MRFQADIETIRAIENKIIATNNFTMVNVVDCDNQHPVQCSERSRAFSHTYEVYISPGASKDLLKAIFATKVIVHFWFDYRIDEANIRVRQNGLEMLGSVVEGLESDLATIGVDYRNGRYGLRPVPQED